jgi:single-stranded-DNA-specific exonuclease
MNRLLSVLSKFLKITLALYNSKNRSPENITTSNVVFTIGPRVNAVGRLMYPGMGTTSENLADAEELCSVLESENSNRKKIDSEICLQAQHSYEITN